MSSCITTAVLTSNVLVTPSQEHHQNPLNQKNLHTTETLGFPIKRLPFEIRRLIYTYYLTSTRTYPVSSTDAFLPHHKIHALYTSSPFFHAEIPASLYYSARLFTFTSGDILRQFSKLHDRQHSVRKIRILLNSLDDQKARNRDWMWLIQECFYNLSDVKLVLPSNYEGKWRGMFTRRWWECVEDVFREGMGYRVVEWEFGGEFRKMFPRLELVDPEGMVMGWSEYKDGGKSHDSGCLLLE